MSSIENHDLYPGLLVMQSLCADINKEVSSAFNLWEQQETEVLRLVATLSVAIGEVRCDDDERKFLNNLLVRIMGELAGRSVALSPARRANMDIITALDERYGIAASELMNSGAVLAKIITDLKSKLQNLQINTSPTHRTYDPAIRSQIHAMSDGKCVYCDVEVPLADMELDHFVPKSSGGPDNMNNYVCACRPCNQTKRDKHPIHFIRQRLGRNVVPFNPNTDVA